MNPALNAAVVALVVAPVTIVALERAPAPQAAPSEKTHAETMTAQEALKLLMDGNERFASGHLTVVGAYYDLDTGKVELLEAPKH